jgi:phage terminase small subunit
VAKQADPGELNEQQERFCYEYLKDLNATQAAIRAGYSADSAKQQGSRLLTKDDVVELISTLRADQLKKIRAESDDILRELARIGMSDIRGLFDEDGNALPIKQWPEDLARAVAAVEVLEQFEYHTPGFHCVQCGKKADKELVGTLKKFKFWPKDRGLEMLGRNRKLFTDKVEHSGAITLEQLVTGQGSATTKVDPPKDGGDASDPS